MGDPTCPVCNQTFERARRGRPRIYCSRRCGKWAANHLSPPKPACSEPGCERLQHAAGLCSTHYNRKKYPDRHALVEVGCAGCGSLVAKPKSASLSRRPTCSYRCRYFVQFGRWPATKELVHVGPVEAAYPPAVADVTVVSGNKRIIVSGPCEWCGETFTRVTFNPTSLPVTCSHRCSRRRQDAKYKSKFAMSLVLREAIYKRDGWTCQLCFEPVDRDADPLSDWFPSLDHIVPQSHQLIPDHSPSNLRTAHRWCNAIRGDGRWHADFFEEAS